MTTTEAQTWFNDPVFRQQTDFIIVALDGVGNSPDNENRGNGVEPQPMNSPDDSTGAKASRAISQSVPGPFFLRYYPEHRLMAWQPQGTLNDLMLDEIAEWLVHIEKAFLPFKRFIDLSQLTTVEVRGRHVFEFARKRAEQFTGVEPVRTALFPTTGSPLASRVSTSRSWKTR